MRHWKISIYDDITNEWSQARIEFDGSFQDLKKEIIREGHDIYLIRELDQGEHSDV